MSIEPYSPLSPRMSIERSSQIPLRSDAERCVDGISKACLKKTEEDLLRVLFRSKSLGENPLTTLTSGQKEDQLYQLFLLSKRLPHLELTIVQKQALKNSTNKAQTTLSMLACLNVAAHHMPMEFEETFKSCYYYVMMRLSEYTDMPAKEWLFFLDFIILTRHEQAPLKELHAWYALVNQYVILCTDLSSLVKEEAELLLTKIKTHVELLSRSIPSSIHLDLMHETVALFEILHKKFPQLTCSYDILIPQGQLFPAVLMYLGRQADQGKDLSAMRSIYVTKIVSHFLINDVRAGMLESIGHLVQKKILCPDVLSQNIANLIINEKGEAHSFTANQLPQVLFALDELQAADHPITNSPAIQNLYRRHHRHLLLRQIGIKTLSP